MTDDGAPVAERDLTSFDGGFSSRCEVIRPDRFRHLDALGTGRPLISRGGGYSYAAASFHADALVIDNRCFNRVLSFDSDRGIIECEAGVTLEEIHCLATPAGWHLSAQPGYPRITVGGCIAADVHGKNQYTGGTFGRSVVSISLFHPSTGTVDLTPDDPLFELTVGGFGLTGHITQARLQLDRLPSDRMHVERVPIASMADTLDVLRAQAEHDSYLYTWHDLTRASGPFGKGIAFSGRFEREGSPPGTTRGPVDERYSSIDAASRRRRSAPLLNRLSTPLFNRAYGATLGIGSKDRTISSFDFQFPVARKTSYFRLFGRAGFHEAQVLIPDGAFANFCAELEVWSRRNRPPISLASCKLFRGTSRHLRFDGDGVAIAIDLPRCPEATEFLMFFDAAMLDHGGRPNVIKDSRLPASVARAACPEYETFRDGLLAFDPRRLFRSELSERLEL